MLVAALAAALAANLLLVSTFGAQPAHACSCSPPSSAKEERLQKADAVFSGVVVDVGTGVSPLELNSRTLPPLPLLPSQLPFLIQLPFLLQWEHEDLVTSFDVEESWKGVSEEPVVVRIDYEPSSCYDDVHEGERYLVYAHRNQDGNGPLSASTHICWRSASKLLYSEKALQALGPAERVFPESADTTTPTSGFGSGPAPVVVASGALLFVAAVGALALWRWRRPNG